MKDILSFAAGLVEDTQTLSGHSDADWVTLESCRDITMSWARELSEHWAEGLYGTAATVPVVQNLNRGDHQQSFAVWYERLVSGAPGDAFWAETCLVGLYHAAAAVNHRHVIAMSTKISELFLKKCMQAFGPERAVEVSSAFTRVFGLALALMVDAYQHAIMKGMEQVGMNEGLVRNMRWVGMRRMIEEARQSLPLIDWSEALSVGIQSIDEQHKKLVALINALHDSSAQGAGNETLKKILAELTQYTIDHFAYEENLMVKHDYAEYTTHKAAHDALTKQVGELNEKFQAGNAKLSGEIFKFLRTWLNGHIRGTDKRYSAYFSEHGVQ